MKILKFIFTLPFLSTAVCAATLDINAPKTIEAEKIEYNVKSNEIKTSGKTDVSNESGARMTLTDSYLANKGADVYASDIEIWLGKRTHITAENITRDNENTEAKKAVFTACNGCDTIGNAWEISMSKMTHNMESHIMQFYNSVFWIYGIPVFWFPYIDMPDPSVKHKSGILMPDVNSTNNMGTQLNLPVYIALSDTHDMTATLSYLTQENPLFRAEHRLNLEHAEFRTNGSFTRNKDGDNRWHIFHRDTIEMGDHVRTKIFLSRASDKTYLQKYGFYEDQPYLDSGASVELFGQSGYVVADMHVFQELRSKYGAMTSVPSGDILPNIRGTYQTSPLFNETYLTLNADVLGISGSGASNQRIIGETKIVSPWTLWGGNRVTASLSARLDAYHFDSTEMMSGDEYSGLKSRFLPSGYVEWGLPLMKGGDNWTHIIEPRARLTIMREIGDAAYALNNDSAGALLSDATLFSSNRFSGLDLWENGTFADYGVRWAAYSNSGHNIEVFLGQSYDFEDKADTDPNSGFHNGASDYVGRIGYRNSDFIELASRFRFAQESMALRHAENTAQIGTSRNYFKVGHIWAEQFIDAKTLADDIHEVIGGFSMYLTDRIGIRFNAIYNITEDRFQRHTGGIFYTHPCYFLSVDYRRDNTIKEDYVGNTTFQFRFGINIDGAKL